MILVKYLTEAFFATEKVFKQAIDQHNAMANLQEKVSIAVQSDMKGQFVRGLCRFFVVSLKDVFWLF